MRGEALVLLKGVVAGAVAGFCSGLSGVSPGGFLVPLTGAGLGVSQHAAQVTSLVAQLLPTGLGGVREYKRKGDGISFRWAAYVASGVVPGGALGALFAQALSEHALKWLFILYLIVLAVLVGQRRATGVANRPLASDPNKLLLGLTGLIAGFCSGLLGIGGGLAIVALTSLLLGFGQHRSQALSLAVGLLPLQVPSVVIYLTSGTDMSWFATAGVVVGLAAFTSVGARIAAGLKERTLRRSFVTIALLLATTMAASIVRTWID